MTEIQSIGQDYIGNRTLILVLAVGLDGDFFPKGEIRGGLLGSVAAGLAFLMATCKLPPV